jgi:iron only hydrogenase large subunit-like protein
MSIQTIYTEQNDCQDCYKCIRHCPVKAIKIEDHRASVVHELCIYCGKCVDICPANAKKVRDDLSAARYLVEQHQVVLSLAPSFLSEFTDYGKEQLFAALYRLGFIQVSETAVGAEMVSQATREWLSGQKQGSWFSSCCPAVVQYICKYHPEHAHRLAPIDSPMQMHAQYIKSRYGQHTRVIFAGPCIAKKREAEEFPRGVDLALTFDELRKWLEEEGLAAEFLDKTQPASHPPQPEQAARGAYYPVEGGMIATMKEHASIIDTCFMSFTGIQNIRQILDHFSEQQEENIFIELMACEGGCINGPIMSKNQSLAVRRWRTLQETKKRPDKIIYNQYPATPVHYMEHIPACGQSRYSEQEIREVLKTVGKASEKDELNCGGCGYESCRQFALAMLEGKAEQQMCVSYMRRVAQNKATVLLQKMPYGVVLVDEHMRIIESNENFARLLGKDAKRLYDMKPGMEGANLSKLASFHKLFANALEQGLEEVNKDLTQDDKLLHLSIFSIQKHKIVCGIVHQLNEEHLAKDQLIHRLQEVIRDNLSTAQKASFLLGENASRTETKLNTIIDSFNQDI